MRPYGPGYVNVVCENLSNGGKGPRGENLPNGKKGPRGEVPVPATRPSEFRRIGRDGRRRESGVQLYLPVSSVRVAA